MGRLTSASTLPLLGLTTCLILMSLAGWASFESYGAMLDDASKLLVRIFQVFVFDVAILAFALFEWKHPRTPPVAIAEAGLASFLIALALLGLNLIWDGASLAVALASSLFFAIGRLFYLVTWIFIAARGTAEETSFEVIVSWTLSGLALIAATRTIPHPAISLLVVLVLVLVSYVAARFFLLNLEKTDAPLPESAVKGAEAPPPFGPYRHLWRDLVPIIALVCLLNFVLALLYRIVIPDESIYGVSAATMQSAVKCGAAGLLLFFWKKLADTDFLAITLQILCLAAMTLAGILAFYDSSSLYFGGIISIVSRAATILVTLFCIQVSRSSRSSVLVVFPAIYGVFSISVSLGDICRLLIDPGSTLPSFAVGVSIACIYVISIGLFAFNIASQRKRDRMLQAQQAVRVESMTDNVQARCDQIAAQCGLSPREKEVLTLIAQGRDAAYVSVRLFISENTVRTHIRKIYNKTGIHNRQELFELVNQVPEA